MTDLAVIMSVYQNDRLKFVKESVQSILDQTFSQFHYFIFFDGPVAQDIDQYINSITDNRIRLYRLEKNEGLANALNYLLKIVLKTPEYKLIARMDADDVSLPERLDKQRGYLLDNPEVSCTGSWFEEIDEEGCHISIRKMPTDHKAITKFFNKRCPLAHSTVMYRRTLIEKAGFYSTDTFHMEDYVMWAKVLRSGLIINNINEYLLKFRIDRNFYKRRSGFKYGYNFIVTRFRINNFLGASISSYFISLLIGLGRMLPVYFVRIIYLYVRKNPV